MAILTERQHIPMTLKELIFTLAIGDVLLTKTWNFCLLNYFAMRKVCYNYFATCYTLSSPLERSINFQHIEIF